MDLRNFNADVVTLIRLVIGASFLFAWYLPLIVRVPLGLILTLFIVGQSLRALLTTLLPRVFPRLSWAAGLIVDVLLSFVLVGLLSSLLVLTSSFDVRLIPLLTGGLVFALNLCAVIFSNWRHRNSFSTPPSIPTGKGVNPLPTVIKGLNMRNILFLASVAYSIMFALWIKRSLPWPQLNGWDFLSYLPTIEHILQKGGLPNFFLEGQYLSPTLFHIFVAALEANSTVPAFNILWYLPIFLMLSYSLIAFVLAYLISKNAFVSFVAAIFAISVTDFGAANGPNFPTIGMVVLLALLAMVCLIMVWPEGYHVSLGLMLITTMVLAALTHPYSLVAMVPIFLVLFLGRTELFVRSSNNLDLIYLFSFGVLFIGAYVFSTIVSWGGVLSIEERLYFFGSSYPQFLPILFLIGALGSVREKRLARLTVYVMITSFFYLFFSFSNIYRLELYQRAFFAIIAANAFNHKLFFPTEPFHLKIARLGSYRLRSRILRTPLVGILVLLVGFSAIYPSAMCSLFGPITNYTKRARWLSNLSMDEYQASTWLRSASSPNDYIITDPATGEIIRAFSFRNASSAFIVEAAAKDPMNYIFADLRGKLKDFLSTSNLCLSTRYFGDIQRLVEDRAGSVDKVWIVLSTRTSVWVESGVPSRTYYDTFRSFSGYGKFREPYFNVEQQFGNVKILSPRPEFLEIEYASDFS